MKSRDVLNSPRRAVRYVYLEEAWPEAKNHRDPSTAILAAPDEAVIAALTKEVDTYGDLLSDERERGNKLEAELNAIRLSARTLGRLFDDEAAPR